ncbi:MAG TPA: alpha/beta hydrolase-fold protein [Thermoplasmata archaeon]|nr:alpha/beta hydrolase-fold protein [Thermoplasmata archaeon]
MTPLRSLGILLSIAVLVIPGAASAISAVHSDPSVNPAVAPVVPSQASTAKLVSYASSVDRFPLSYYEYLPKGFSSTTTYPLIVYLHGIQGDSKWTRGGVTSDFMSLVTQKNSVGASLSAIVSNASSRGYLLIVLNTRTGDGFYANTTCGGPQEQDVLDAISHEQSLRHVGHIYLLGFSMGSIGALSLAAHHPGMFSGIAMGGTNTDFYAAYAYRVYANSTGQAWAKQSLSEFRSPTCGTSPTVKNATTQALYNYLSVARLHPQALAGTPIWVAAGGADPRVPDNPSRFAYLQVNNSFVNSTCLVFYTEPKNCTTTFWSLHNATPTKYVFRFVWMALGQHTVTQFDAGDIFGFWAGSVGWGFYTANWPPTTLVSNSHPGR